MMLILIVCLIFVRSQIIASLQCYNGSLSVVGGEVSVLPVQQVSCTEGNFCSSSYANNGDTILLSMGCAGASGQCKNPDCYLDNSTIQYDLNVCCCSTDLCNNMTVNTPIRRTFPSNFLFGTATASYQVEGGAFADGKGLNIWDTFTHIPNTVNSNSTGDDACKSYELYEEDVKNLKYKGVQFI